MEYDILISFVNVIFIYSLGFYLLHNLQWFNYSILRILTKHTKPYWHVVFVVIPIGMFFVLGEYFCAYLVLHVILLGYWYYKLDKKLVWTNRVKRFFVTLGIFLVMDIFVRYAFDLPHYVSFIAFVIALIVSYVGESVIMMQYKNLASQKIQSLHNMKIIAITASFGKTSIKHILYRLLSHKYNVHMTSGSINTINGIISDINNNLSSEHDVYIVEAGARMKGDIAKIARLLNPHYAIIGEIGEVHLQYFHNIENITSTKYELIQSNRLEELFLYEKNTPPQTSAHIIFFPPDIANATSTLEKTTFSLKIHDKYYDFETKLLGTFNIKNISVAILVAHKFGVEIPRLQKLVARLKPIEHRLERMDSNGKIILDDSFNGNLEGMSEAIRLASLHNGKKIIVTPGIVENSIDNNVKLAELIDGVFDVAIITGSLNSKILSKHISKAQKIILGDKSNLDKILASICQAGDLILFANDAPSYV